MQPIFSDSSEDDDQSLPPLPFSFHNLKHSKEHVADQTHGSVEITVPSAQQPQSSKNLDLEALANKPSSLCLSYD